MDTRSQIKILVEKLGFKIVNAEYNRASFGNNYTTLLSNNFYIRFVTDKGQTRVELCSRNDHENWYDLVFVRNFIENPTGGINTQYSESEIAGLMEFLENHIKEIEVLFSGDRYSSFKNDINKRLKDEFKKNFPGTV